jgi:hypothetical protein
MRCVTSGNAENGRSTAAHPTAEVVAQHDVTSITKNLRRIGRAKWAILLLAIPATLFFTMARTSSFEALKYGTMVLIPGAVANFQALDIITYFELVVINLWVVVLIGWTQARKAAPGGIPLLVASVLLGVFAPGTFSIAVAVLQGFYLFNTMVNLKPGHPFDPLTDYNCITQMMVVWALLLMALYGRVSLRSAIRRVGFGQASPRYYLRQVDRRGRKMPLSWPSSIRKSTVTVLLILLAATAGVWALWSTFGLLLTFTALWGQFMEHPAYLLTWPLLTGGYWMLFGFARAAALRRLSTPTYRVLQRDERAPVLLLRSFGDDVIRMPKPWWMLRLGRARTFEEVLATELWRVGPVTAIGKPGERLPRVGAAREYVTNELWKQRVAERVEEAQLVVMVIGTTEGLAWEVQHMLERGVAPKLLLAIPPRAAAARWEVFRQHLGNFPESEALHELSLKPEQRRHSLFVFLHDKGKVAQIVARKRFAPFYAQALRLAVYLLLGPSAPKVLAS